MKAMGSLIRHMAIGRICQFLPPRSQLLVSSARHTEDEHLLRREWWNGFRHGGSCSSLPPRAGHMARPHLVTSTASDPEAG